MVRNKDTRLESALRAGYTPTFQHPTSRLWPPVHAAVLRRAEGCDANRTSGRSSLRAVLRKFYRSGEQIS